MRALMLLISCLYLNGGCRHARIPVLHPISKITAVVHAVPGFSVVAINSVEVPQSQLSSFARLITPMEPCLQKIHPDEHHHVADVYVEHIDGTQTKLIVRWTGHGPAAVSLDGRYYYYGGSDEFPDGATSILRLLSEYNYKSQHSSHPVGR